MWSALDPTLIDDWGDSHRGPFFNALSELRWYGVSLPLLAFGSIMTWSAWVYLRRIFEPRALWIDETHLIFHPTVRKGPVALSEITGIRAQANGIKSELVISVSSGSPIVLDNVHDLDAIEFAAWLNETHIEQS